MIDAESFHLDLDSAQLFRIRSHIVSLLTAAKPSSQSLEVSASIVE